MKAGTHCEKFDSPRRALVAALVAATLASRLAAEPLQPTPAQQATAKLVAEAVAAQHYRPRPLDARLSSDIYERFLASLDPNRDILSSEDVASVEKYRARLVDTFRTGDLEGAYAIYALYRTRLDARLETVRAALGKPQALASAAEPPPSEVNATWSTPAVLDEHWRERLAGELLNLVLSGRERGAAVDILRKRYEQLGARAAAQGADDVFQLFIDAYARSLDPHSEYFLPRRALRGAEQAPLEGIGAQLKTDREYVAIRRLFDGGAADRSGRVHAGDRILAVGQGASGELVDVVGWPLDPVVDMIRGAVGSTVRLELLPKGADARRLPTLVSLVRDKINLQEQAPRKRCDEMNGRRLCVIAVPRFYIDYAGAGRGAGYAGVAADVARLLNEERDAPPDGLLLDLRGNGGGALLEAARLAGLFLDVGIIVQVKHATGEVEQFADPVPGSLYDGPLVVLIDRYSASATEIFAAAIHDYRRGSILGEHSYGKGTVQETLDLNADEGAAPTFGQLVLTTAEYFRATGKSTQLAGVDVDLALPPWPGASDYGERFEANPLEPGEVPPARFEPVANAVLVGDAARARHAERVERDPALHALMVAASERAAAPAPALNESQRRAELDRIRRADQALDRGLSGALAGRDEDLAGAPAETRWRELMLIEAERVLADSISFAAPQKD
jgi:carboxyl-terminal processing protease